MKIFLIFVNMYLIELVLKNLSMLTISNPGFGR